METCGYMLDYDVFFCYDDGTGIINMSKSLRNDKKITRTHINRLMIMLL